MLLFRVKHENWIITELSKLKNKWSKIQSRKVCISLVSHIGVELPKKKKNCKPIKRSLPWAEIDLVSWKEQLDNVLMRKLRS